MSDYLAVLNSGNSPAPAPSSPGVDHLLRTALDRKVAPSLRAHLNLQLLLQRLADHGLLDCREIRDLALGPVTIKGGQASAELYYQGTLPPLRLPFVKQNQIWKIDLLAMLPYAEVLMRVDRAVNGRTESQQVEQLVSHFPRFRVAHARQTCHPLSRRP